MDGGREVIVVSTAQGASRPYTYRGSAYRRVGNTTLPMSADEYNRMLFERMHSEQRWENQPAAGWSVNDLDVAEIRRTVAEAVRRGRLEEPVSGDPSTCCADSAFCAMACCCGRRRCCSAAGNGSNSRCRSACSASPASGGMDRMEFLDNRQFNGHAFTLLASAERFLRDTLPIAGRFEQARFERIDEPLYPPLATREALANALCHRDYSIGGGSVGIAIYDDRLEVTSSGSLHFGLTPEKLSGRSSAPWGALGGVLGALWGRLRQHTGGGDRGTMGAYRGVIERGRVPSLPRHPLRCPRPLRQARRLVKHGMTPTILQRERERLCQ